MNIHDILQDPAQLKALTTLDPAEFRNLVRPFDRAFVQRRKMYSITGKRRRIPASRVRLSKPTKVLPTREERLLFILLSLKTDAIQQHLALTFGLKQTTVSKWQRFLEPVLDKTLRRLGHRPARTLDELVAQLNARHHADERSGAPGDGDGGDGDGGDGDGDDYGANRAAESLHIDATTRSVPRSGDAAAQRYDYSGKAHAHVVKNTVVCAADQRIVYLGPTWRGAMHDKRMADEELPDLCAVAPLGLWLSMDSGYLGYRPAGVHLLATQRARRNRPLTDVHKEMNRWIGSVRIVVEHAIGGIKRLVKATRMRVLSVTRADQLMQLAASLHNYRVECRTHQYAISRARTNVRLQPFPD